MRKSRRDKTRHAQAKRTHRRLAGNVELSVANRVALVAVSSYLAHERRNRHRARVATRLIVSFMSRPRAVEMRTAGRAILWGLRTRRGTA